MHKTLFLLSFVVMKFIAFSQEKDSASFIFDEVSLSVNRSVVEDQNTKDLYGFGIGVHHTFRRDKKLTVQGGIEYNQTGQHKKLIFEGTQITFQGNQVYEKTLTDVTYRLNCLSIPFAVRYNFGTTTKFFIESGLYADLIFNASRNAYVYSIAKKDNVYQAANASVRESVNLVNTVGTSFGLGVSIPYKKYRIVVKPEFKFALRKIYDSPIAVTNMFNHYGRLLFSFQW